jgi:hypothetical protein
MRRDPVLRGEQVVEGFSLVGSVIQQRVEAR